MSKINTLLAFVLSFAFLVSAQTPQLPTCASSCVISSPPAGCSQTDFGCICKNQAYISTLGCCAVAACPASDLPAVSAFASNLCQQAGVTVDTTPPTNCPGQTATTNGTSTNSSSTSGSSTSASASPTAKSSAPGNFANNLASFITVTGALVAGSLLL